MTTSTVPPQVRRHPGPPTGARARRLQVAAFLVVALLVGLLAHTIGLHRTAAPTPGMPTNVAMEQQLGVRFTRVAVVADGGLVEVSYVVLDSDKATRFQDDQAHLPVLTNADTGTSTSRVALMKQGHSLPVGLSYYFVYQDNGTVRQNDHATLTTHGLSLTGITVQ